MYIYVNVCILLYGIHFGQCIKNIILIQFIFTGTVFNNDEVVGFALVRTILSLSMVIASLYFTALRFILALIFISDLFYGFIQIYILIQFKTSSYNISMLLRIKDIFFFYCRLIEVLKYHLLLKFITIYRLLYKIDYY